MRRIHANQIDKGKLQFNTTQNNRARPVVGAKISLFQTDESGNERQIEEIVTDNSGQTTEIELPAPPLDYSLLPGSPMPYSQYNIVVNADGFAPLSVRDIQVLPSSLALQNCPLEPAEIFTQQEAETITIDHHTLYYEYPPKNPEDAVKPLPPPTGFVVLDRVVVPETIVVHDGPPDANAPNYYIPFRDYIKNVASSEIYSTWPDAALKANILCILSFVLNRVFTVMLP
ncbi:MAG: carboxypeptidase regulatory-like domain-containing protein [Defluviitaleaceae bacterium]|nr:carboxypeptidase regulatory-like domain-containing protein [Defluviitaleaceae bacterium]